jgi:hypothetical protein
MSSSDDGNADPMNMVGPAAIIFSVVVSIIAFIQLRRYFPLDVPKAIRASKLCRVAGCVKFFVATGLLLLDLGETSGSGDFFYPMLLFLTGIFWFARARQYQRAAFVMQSHAMMQGQLGIHQHGAGGRYGGNPVAAGPRDMTAPPLPAFNESQPITVVGTVASSVPTAAPASYDPNQQIPIAQSVKVVNVNNV